MSIPPPPPPRSRAERPGAYSAPSSGGATARFGSAPAAPDFGAGSRGGGRAARPGRGGSGVGSAGRDSASPIPLLIGVGAVVVSLLIAVVTAVNGRASSVWFVTLPIIEPDQWWLSLIGYVLTPLVVIVAFGLNRIWQRDGLRDRAFTPKPGYSLALKWLVGAGFLIALWHIVNLATVVSEQWVSP